MLQNILPLVEALAGEGGLMAGLGSRSGGGAGLESLAGHFGFAKSFGSAGEMGGALRKMNDLAALVETAKKSIDDNKQKQADIAKQARESEQLTGMSDPAHQAKLAELEAQNHAQQQSMQQHQRQLSALNSRLFATNNPATASFRRAGTALAGIQAVQAFGPSLVQQLPGVQAAQNTAGFLVGPTNAAIGGQMAQQAAALAAAPFTGAAKGAAIGSLLGPVGTGAGAVLGGLAGTATELSKLPHLLQQWGQELVNSKMHLAQFSPVLAGAKSEAERRGIRRDILSAGNTGGNIADLSDKLQGLHDLVRPIQDFTTNTLATQIGVGIDILREAVTGMRIMHGLLLHIPVIGKYLKGIEVILEQKKDPGPAEMPFATFLNQANQQALERFAPKRDE